VNIPILFEDAEALVIDKPGGLPIERRARAGVRSRTIWTTSGWASSARRSRSTGIDTDTSGCLLLARNPKALKRFARAFEERQVGKRYLGMLAGIPMEREGTVELALSKISSAEKGWRMIPAKKGKPAVTHWRVLGEAGAVRWSNSAPRPAGRTRFASTRRAGSASPCSAIRSTATARVRRERCSMPPASKCSARASRRLPPLRRCRQTSPRWGLPMDDEEVISRALELAEESFIAGTGPGGQNVNKVATAVQLRLDVFALRLPPPAFQRLKRLAGSRMTSGGEIVLAARRYRTQEANREDGRARLSALIESGPG
jgi:hypothetical protein